MSEIPNIDLESLLQPISEREPAGEWLRYEGTYDAIGEARREDDETLPQGIWQTKLKRADWSRVSVLGQKALRERSKDLQIAAWLCEAWLKLYGLPGLALGLRLCTQLMSRFWNTLYPLIEEGDASYRMAPTEYLSAKVAGRLKEVPLTEGFGEKQPLCWVDWERALRNEKVQGGSDEILPSVFLAAAGGTSPKFYSVLFAQLADADAAAVELEALIVGKLPDQPASLRLLRNLISDIRALIAQYMPVVSDSEAAAENGQDGAQPGRPAPGGDMAESQVDKKDRQEESHSGPIRSRAQAFQRLVEAADYLQRTEPHSPVPYLVKRAVAWGNMDLIQLLGELVSEGADRQGIYALLGVKSGH